MQKKIGVRCKNDLSSRGCFLVHNVKKTKNRAENAMQTRFFSQPAVVQAVLGPTHFPV